MTEVKKAKSKVLFPYPVCKQKPEVKSSPSGLPQNYSSKWTRLLPLMAQQFQRSWRGAMVCPSSPRGYFQRAPGLGLGAGTNDNCFICAFSDEEKIEFEWNTGTNMDTNKAASNFPVDLSDYLKSLHMYANSLLDHRVPQTDMTFRHMGSKLIVVSTNQSVDKYMVIRTNYILNPELGERGYPKMDKVCFLPQGIPEEQRNTHAWIVTQLHQAVCDTYLMNSTRQKNLLCL